MEEDKQQEQLSEEDYGMAEYIWKLLKLQQIVIWSWGVDPKTVRTIKQGIEFHVQGFLLKGTVRITYDLGEDLFNVELIPDDKSKPKEKLEGLYLDNLVLTIDRHVEYCEDYVERILEEYQDLTEIRIS